MCYLKVFPHATPIKRPILPELRGLDVDFDVCALRAPFPPLGNKVHVLAEVAVHDPVSRLFFILEEGLRVLAQVPPSVVCACFGLNADDLLRIGSCIDNRWLEGGMDG